MLPVYGVVKGALRGFAKSLAREWPPRRPETEIGPAVVFLASEAAGYVTGQTLAVDGGRFMTL